MMMLCWRHRPFDKFSRQRLGVPRAVMAQPVHEESGRAIYSTADSAVEILANTVTMRARCDFMDHAAGVQSEVQGVLRETFIVQGVLILVQNVMHFPVAALLTGRLGRLSGVFGVGMNFGQREIAEHKTQPVSQN